MNKLILIMSAVALSITLANESRAEYKHTYDDEGRLSSVGDYYKINFSYNENNEIVDARAIYDLCGGGTEEVHVLTDRGDGTYFAGFEDHAVVVDVKGRILQEGSYHNVGGEHAGFLGTSYKYDYDGDEKISRTAYNCNYANSVSQCTQTNDEPEYFTYDKDDFGNIINEYVGGTLVASNTYSPAYLEKQATQNACSNTSSCTSCPDGKVLQSGKCVSSCGPSFRLNDGECDRIRYTPAEAAQYLKDTDNTIIMTFKVNR